MDPLSRAGAKKRGRRREVAAVRVFPQQILPPACGQTAGDTIEKGEGGLKMHSVPGGSQPSCALE